MSTPRDDYSIMHEWKRIEESLEKEGRSRTNIYREIANRYKVDRATVYYWLAPGYREKRMLKMRKSTNSLVESGYYKELYKRKKSVYGMVKLLTKIVFRDDELSLREAMPRLANVMENLENDGLLMILLSDLQVCETRPGVYAYRHMRGIDKHKEDLYNVDVDV